MMKQFLLTLVNRNRAQDNNSFEKTILTIVQIVTATNSIYSNCVLNKKRMELSNSFTTPSCKCITSILNPIL